MAIKQHDRGPLRRRCEFYGLTIIDMQFEFFDTDRTTRLGELIDQFHANKIATHGQLIGLNRKDLPITLSTSSFQQEVVDANLQVCRRSQQKS